jgi:gluconolactonase
MSILDSTTTADEATTAFTFHDPAFGDVLGPDARLVRVVEVDAHEGPVYAAHEDTLYFTTLPRETGSPAPGFPVVDIKRLELDGDRFPLEPGRVETVRANANAANGMTLGLDGRLLVCEQGTPANRGQITRLDPSTKRAETIVDRWRDLPFNSPNDVVARHDGTIWFTDPSYGHLQGFKPKPLAGDYVYRYDPRTDRVSVVADSFDKPNGLAFSPDGSVLYVGDSGANQEQGSFYPARPHHIVAFDVTGGGRLVNPRLFAVTAPGFPDGIKVDSDGRVYASSFAGVEVFSPEGELVGEISLPGAVNFAFGGSDRNILFITADTAIWAAVLNATGPEPSRRKEA